MSDQTKKPISEVRLTANRVNAEKSTGLKTAAAKPLPNEPTDSGQPAETKPVTSPVAPLYDPNPEPDGPESRAES